MPQSFDSNSLNKRAVIDSGFSPLNRYNKRLKYRPSLMLQNSLDSIAEEKDKNKSNRSQQQITKAVKDLVPPVDRH